MGVLGSTALLPVQNLVHAEEPEQEISVDQFAQENNLIYNETTAVTYGEDGQIESQEVKEEATTNTGEVLASETTQVPVEDIPAEPVNNSNSNVFSSKSPKTLGSKSFSIIKDLPTTNVVVNPGGIEYELIDKFNGNNKIFVSATGWIREFLVSGIPARLFKNPWAQAAGQATADFFLPESELRYYTTWIYQDNDSQAFYGKAVSKEYKTSARTKVLKTLSHVTRVPRTEARQ